MKRLTVLFTLAFLVFLIGCSSNTGNDSDGNNNKTSKNETVELDFGHVLTEDSSYQVIAEELATNVQQETNGEVEITIFPSSQLGSNETMTEAAIQGSQAFYATDISALENIIPELSALSLPYVFDDGEQALKILNGEVGELINSKLEEKGLMSLGWMVVERNVFSKKPVESISDMQGMKIRVVSAPSYVDSYEAFGSQPTPMDYAEVYTGLQQGSIDGGEAVIEQYVQDKFLEVAKYYSFTRVHQMPTLLVMSKQIFDDLAPEHQEDILKAGKLAMEAGVKNYHEKNEELLEEMQQEGVKVTNPDLTEFKEAVEDVQVSLLKDNPGAQELFDKIQAEK